MRIYLFFTVILFLSENLSSQDYYSDRLFVKIKPQYIHDYQLIKDKRVLKALNETNLLHSKQVSKHPLLSSVYELIFDSTVNISPLMEDMNSWEEIEYAERVPLYKLFFTPNDPLYSSQWNLVKIQADLAWNLGQGCTQVKIAVTDDAFLMNHEDLVNQWHINTGEVNGNGIDDDGNGYIDDWRGWDAANNDNDPSATAPTNTYFTHGTHVAGIVAGQTHNSKGIAAIGYNCKMIPVKIGLDANSSLTGAFQGLDFAINASGCDVINMSWGGGGWSATFQTLFNIAKSKGIICVAAAGNSNTSAPMYPASYNHVISVAASASTDARASFSNYGSTIDVTAPGVNIPSCLAGATNAYGNFSGTSMASPLVAGLCALMKCYNPMPADSIEACLKRTCDNINAQNPSFIGQLGAGRINAFQALQCLTKKPKSDFIALDTFQCIGKSVRYAAKSFGIPTLTYNWSFPGGTPASSTAANPIVTYSSNGYKSATLITCNSLGCDTMTKMNLVHIDTPKAWLNGRVYTTINAMNISLAVHFRGNPPYQVTLTDGTNVWTQSNIKANPYFFSIQPKKDTSHIFISSFTDSLCSGSGAGRDTIYRKNLTKDTTICLTLKTSQNGALDGFGFTPASSTNITWTFTNNENVVANWTSAGSPHFWRCILKFNLNDIPANAVINSAIMSLYSKSNANHGWSGQPTAGTDNSTSISRITNSWTTGTISTSAWPTVAAQNQVVLPQSPSNNHSYSNIDVKNLFQDLVTNGNNGIFLRHVNTPYYNSLIFHSAESTDTSKHPKLVICYTIPAGGSTGGGSSDCDTTGLNTGKVLHLDFNGNTQDKSGNGNHATNYGATPVAGKDGVANTAYRFDTMNYMSVAHHANLNLRSFTLTAILKPLKFNTDICFTNTVISKGTGAVGAQWALQYAPTTSTTCFNRDTSNCNMILCGSACPSNSVTNTLPYMIHNKWECAVVTYDSATKEIKMYMNGVLRHQWTSTFTSLTSQNAAAVLIGKFGDPTYPGHLQGIIDDIRIYNRVLAPAEVKGYCGTCNTPPPSDCDTTGLILCMSMDGNANDSTKYAHHGIIRGATPTNNRFGSSNSAYAFNGISNYINLGNKSLLKPNKATISMWVKPNTPSTHGYGYAFNPLMVTGNTNTPGNMCEAYFIGVSSSGNNKFHASSWNPATSSSGGGPSIQSYSINTWYHLTAIFDNDSVRIYINGNLDKSYFKGFSTNYSSLDSIIIGYSGNNTSNQRWFNGAIDDVKMYNRVLTASEVQSLYTKPFTCTCSSTPPPSDCDTTNLNTGKVLHLDFNGNTQDKSGNGNHATNYGATLVAGKDGVANTAYRFDGVNDYMIVTHSSSINIGNQATLTAKLKINGFYSGVCHGNMIMTKGTSNHHFVYSPSGYNGGNCVANLDTLHQNVFCSSSASVNNSSYLPFLEKNKWYCLVYTQKNDSAYIFMDGILVHRQYNNSTNNTDDLSIGRYMSSVYPYWINADVDDIRIYNRALAPSEVKGYCGTCTPSQPPLCDTSRSFAYTQCLNDSLQVNLRPGSQYQWSPKLGLSSDTVANPKIYVRSNQRYFVSYIGLRGCQVVDTIDISVRNSAIYPNMDDQLICIGDSVQMTIPIFATDIVWSPNLSISSINAKNPYFFPTTNRTYYLEFRDTFGCLHRDTFIVNTKVCCPARARFTIPKDMLCFGETLRPINTSKGPITSYNWNFGTANPNSFAGVNPPSISFPSGGSYSLRLIVTNGICFDTMTKVVNVIQIHANAGKDTHNCLGAFVTQLGDFSLSDWRYSWTPTKYLSNSNIADPVCSIVNDSVNYVLEVTDMFSGCKAKDTVIVYTNRNILSKEDTLRICDGDSVLYNGVYRKTADNYYYTVKKSDGICDSFIDVLRLSVLKVERIRLTPVYVCEYYTDAKGRIYYDSFTEYDSIKSKSIPNCDSIINYRNINISKTIYKTREVAGCAPFRFNGKTYSVSKNKVDSLRTRSVMFPCDSIIEYVNVVVYPKPKAEITPSIPNPVMYKQTVTLTASGGQTYLWLQTGSTNQDIDYKINNTQPKLYTVRVTDENDCWDTVSYLIKGILPDTCYYGFPNVFSPNQDNLNDEYIPNMDECTEIKVFAIYDRWGEKVFETNEQKGWNGTFKGKPAPMAVYLYYAELITPWGVKIHKGTFTLVR